MLHQRHGSGIQINAHAVYRILHNAVQGFSQFFLVHIVLVLTNTYVAVYKVSGDTVSIYRVVNGTTDYPRLLK